MTTAETAGHRGLGEKKLDQHKRVGVPTAKQSALPYYGSVISLILLILLGVIWEGWLAPLRPGGSLMTLKVLPLLVPLFGILRGRIYTYQYSSMLIWFYFTEGVVRAWSEHGISRWLASTEIALSLIFYSCALCHVRLHRPVRAK